MDHPTRAAAVFGFDTCGLDENTLLDFRSGKRLAHDLTGKAGSHRPVGQGGESAKAVAKAMYVMGLPSGNADAHWRGKLD
ncbi:hypothetical protein [Rhodobacter ferrooxidans]|uniref:hypothetical protein n=1 Tax=Rhodobacter ferrooxidans TaxID=371731 RepID=UPI0012E99C51|nr:hypothetical protein [Rhodobacter sp. SW2]